MNADKMVFMYPNSISKEIVPVEKDKNFDYRKQRLFYDQNTLENIVGDIVTLHKENKTYDEINTTLKKYDKKASLELVNDNNEYVKIILTKKVDLNAPGINLIINDPYTVKVSRVIYYEEQ